MAAVSSSAYVSVATRRFLARAWWPGLLIVPLIVWGLMRDLRFAFLGLILLFVVYPMLAVLAIMRHSINPRLAARSTATHFDLEGLKIRCIRITEADDGSTTSEDVDCAAVTALERSGDRLIFITGPRVCDFVIASHDAIAPEALAQLTAKLAEADGFE